MSYSYSYKTSSSGGAPRSGLSNDAEFQAAKMQAMMGGLPSGGNTGSSYSYHSSSSSGGGMPSNLGMRTGGSLEMDAEMARMQREMNKPLSPRLDSGGSSSYSYSSKSSSGTGGALSPTSIHVSQEPASSRGSTVKKVVTTTTTKTNPQAAREFESLERDFSRIGRTPDNYTDDFDKIKREIITGEAYKGDKVTCEPVSIRTREEHLRNKLDTPDSRFGNSGVTSETKTTTTTRSYGSGAPVTEETYVKTTSGGVKSPSSLKSEVFIPVKTYDNTFDDLHMNRWFDHRDNFGTSLAAPELDRHRMEWENRLGGMKSGFFKFSPHGDLGGQSTIESSKTVSKNPLGKPEFSVQFDMRDFKAEDITLTTKYGKLIVSATHEDKVGNSTSRREFTRTVDLPADIQINMMRSVFSRDGVLSVTAPIKPPTYDHMRH